MTKYNRLRPKSNKAIFLFICLVVLMAASAGLNAQQREETNSSKSCLWVVETPSNRFFLLGSLHLLKSDAGKIPKYHGGCRGRTSGPEGIVQLLKQKGYAVKQK
jgi:uncharacterized protein YbaP (TraB family)